MRRRGLGHPRALVPRFAPRLHALLRGRALAPHDSIELLPVDLAEVVAALLLVPLEVGIWYRQLQEIGLRDRDVDELLAKLVIGLALDPPAHRLGGVRAVGVGRA